MKAEYYAYLVTHTTALPIQLSLVSSFLISLVMSPLLPIILLLEKLRRVCALRTDYVTAKQP
jgi:hypothetical protein